MTPQSEILTTELQQEQHLKTFLRIGYARSAASARKISSRRKNKVCRERTETRTGQEADEQISCLRDGGTAYAFLLKGSGRHP